MLISWCSVVVSGVVFPAVASATDEAGDGYAALTAGFQEGDYGTSTNTELYSLTPEFGYVSPRYELSVAVPFYRLDISAAGMTASESGIGDAVLRGGRRLWQDESGEYYLNGALLLKLATGDQDTGLGTGATDIGVSLSGTRYIGVYAFTALVGYTQVGEPDGVVYDNVVSYGIGINRSFTRTNVFASLQGQTSALPGGTDPLGFDIGFFHMLSMQYVIIAHTLFGLSNGSPDNGLGIGIVRWF